MTAKATIHLIFLVLFFSILICAIDYFGDRFFYFFKFKDVIVLGAAVVFVGGTFSIFQSKYGKELYSTKIRLIYSFFGSFLYGSIFFVYDITTIQIKAPVSVYIVRFFITFITSLLIYYVIWRIFHKKSKTNDEEIIDQ